MFLRLKINSHKCLFLFCFYLYSCFKLLLSQNLKVLVIDFHAYKEATGARYKIHLWCCPKFRRVSLKLCFMMVQQLFALNCQRSPMWVFSRDFLSNFAWIISDTYIYILKKEKEREKDGLIMTCHVRFIGSVLFVFRIKILTFNNNLFLFKMN